MKRIALFILFILCFGSIGIAIYNLDPYAIDIFGFGIFYFILLLGFWSLFTAIGFKRWQVLTLLLLIFFILMFL